MSAVLIQFNVTSTNGLHLYLSTDDIYLSTDNIYLSKDDIYLSTDDIYVDRQIKYKTMEFTIKNSM